MVYFLLQYCLFWRSYKWIENFSNSLQEKLTTNKGNFICMSEINISCVKKVHIYLLCYYMFTCGSTVKCENVECGRLLVMFADDSEGRVLRTGRQHRRMGRPVGSRVRLYHLPPESLNLDSTLPWLSWWHTGRNHCQLPWCKYSHHCQFLAVLVVWCDLNCSLHWANRIKATSP